MSALALQEYLRERDGMRWVELPDAVVHVKDGEAVMRPTAGKLSAARVAELREMKPALLALLAAPVAIARSESPREHFFGLGKGYEEVGIVGRFGMKATGELMLAMQAAEADPTRAAEYWRLAERLVG